MDCFSSNEENHTCEIKHLWASSPGPSPSFKCAQHGGWWVDGLHFKEEGVLKIIFLFYLMNDKGLEKSFNNIKNKH